VLCQLKANQPRLHDAMHKHAQQRPAADCAYDCDVGQRNRIEQREVRVWALLPGSGVEPWHDHFLTLVEVRRTTEVFDTAKARFVLRTQTPAYYLSTLSSAEVTAREFARLVRKHWSIENSLHHVLDTTMAEDASRIRRNPGVFACLRQLALNLLRGNGERNISQALYRNALSLDKVLNYAGIWQE
jgi:predicted transposase YbfD/YdcC